MSAKHTPGPWFAEKSSGDFYYITGEPDAFAPALAQTWNAGRFIREQEANARLIAAAPCLLEALKETVELLEQTLRWRGDGWECSEDELLGTARAALSRALGQDAAKPLGEQSNG